MIDFTKMKYGVIKGEGNFTIVINGRFHTFDDSKFDKIVKLFETKKVI